MTFGNMDWKNNMQWLVAGALVLAIGLFTWTLISARQARSECYATAKKWQHDVQRRNTLERSWLRELVKNDVKIRRKPGQLLDVSLPEVPSQTSGIAQTVLAVLSNEVNMIENGPSLDERWKHCREIILDEYRQLLGDEGITIKTQGNE